MKTVFNGGYVEDFENNLKKINSRKESFTTITSGKSRKIIYDNGKKMNFFGRKGKTNFIDGCWLTNVVVKEIDKYIEQNGIPENLGKVDVQQFNFKTINKVIGSKKPILGIDIDRCYWTTAYKLGYISETLYKRAFTATKKQGLLISIGVLNKMPMIRRYENGKCVKIDYDVGYHNRYSPFYWQIIHHTYNLLMESYQLFKKDWYMFLTDCVFVNPAKAKEVKEFFESWGYNVKNHTIDFTAYDGQNLTWYDTKAQNHKSVFAQGRDVEINYKIWKIVKGK
jgi:hypothetical protein